jgi:hypothetical protein
MNDAKRWAALMAKQTELLAQLKACQSDTRFFSPGRVRREGVVRGQLYSVSQEIAAMIEAGYLPEVTP